ncbi:hypothetical protein TNCT_16061, partial [Trichonephila clavata]
MSGHQVQYRNDNSDGKNLIRVESVFVIPQISTTVTLLLAERPDGLDELLILLSHVEKKQDETDQEIWKVKQWAHHGRSIYLEG